MTKSSKRTRSRKPRVLTASTDSEELSLDAVCDVNFQITVLCDKFAIKFLDTRPGLEGKIVIDDERSGATADVEVYVPTGTKHVYDKTLDSLHTGGAVVAALENSALHTDMVPVKVGGTSIINYYFDNRNIPFFEVKKAFNSYHATMS